MALAQCRRTHIAAVLLGVALAVLLLGLVLSRHARGAEEGIVPLYQEIGVYLATIRFQGAEADCVVDTGSSNLLLAGRSCRSCDDPTSLRVRKPPTDTLVYGSQQSDVTWRTGTLRVGRRRIAGVRAALARAMEGDTQYNVFGLARGALQQAVAPDRFAVAMLPNEGVLALGDVGLAALRRRFAYREADVARVPLLRDALPMYAVRGALRVRGEARPAWRGEVIVDTGSNFLSCHSRVFEQLQGRCFGRDATLLLEMVASDSGPAVTLAWSPDVYRHRSDALLAEADDTLGEDAIVLGSFFMRQLVLEVHHAEQCVGFARVA